MITLEAMGLDNATEMADFYLAAIGEYEGVFYRGSRREASDEPDAAATNAEVVAKLADPQAFGNEGPRRDLQTMSAEKANQMGDGWKFHIDAAAMSMVKKDGAFKKPYARKEAWERAKIAAARAWRAAGQAYMEEMWRRATNQISADENGNESAAASVSPSYAKKRQQKYGVDPGAVYKATGQLLEDLNPSDPGRLTLIKGQNRMDRDFMASELRDVGSAIGKMIKPR